MNFVLKMDFVGDENKNNYYYRNFSASSATFRLASVGGTFFNRFCGIKEALQQLTTSLSLSYRSIIESDEFVCLLNSEFLRTKQFTDFHG